MEEEMKIKILDDRMYENVYTYTSYCNNKKIRIENLGIEIKGLNSREAEYIKKACGTKYGKILIECIINNPKFDLTEFMYEMQLEDIEKEEPSKVLVSAKGIEIEERVVVDLFRSNELSEYEVKIKQRFEQNPTQIYRLLSREQVEIMKKCAEKNKYYNFYGPTQENHGFDIETFGVDFLSYLNHGLEDIKDTEDYIYNVIKENSDLLEIIKNNSKAAKFMGIAVNEYQYLKLELERIWESDIEGSIDYIDERQKLRSIFKQRIQECLSIKLENEVEMPNVEPNELISGYALFHPTTLMESNSMEYLKNSRRNNMTINNIQEQGDEQLPIVQNKFRKNLGKLKTLLKGIFSSNKGTGQLTDKEVRQPTREDNLKHVKGFNVSEEKAKQKTINDETRPLQNINYGEDIDVNEDFIK